MSKKVLLVSTRALPVDGLGWGDLESVYLGFINAGFNAAIKSVAELYITANSDDYSVYDLIVFIAPGSSLYISNEKSYFVFNKIYREAKHIAMIYSDITFPVDVKIWNPKVGRKETVCDLFASRPVTVLASFSQDIVNSETALSLLKSKVTSRLHQESRVVFLEWLLFSELLFNFKGAASVTDLTSPLDCELNLFYYGIAKNKLKNSLLKLGLGNTPSDAVFGKVSKMFPDVRKLDNGKNVEREFWVPYTKVAKHTLFPYEPVKGDFQVTPRALEANAYYKHNVLVDDSVSEYIKKFIYDRNEWHKGVERVKSELASVTFS